MRDITGTGPSNPDRVRKGAPIVVQKYGGSSVATPEKLTKVAAKVAAARDAGAHVAVVVSAMGGKTDELVRLAAGVSCSPPARELDALLTAGERMSTALLAMALEERGVPAVSLDGVQCGIVTDAEHGRAQIRDVRADRVHDELASGRVTVVAGFQGVSERGEITTLGRGGSDTTATALAAALGAAYCDIFSDVEGVYTTDPRICDDAQRIDELGYETMIELARQGAKVLNQRAVEHAREGSVVIRARSTFGGPGTTFVGAPDGVVSIGRGGARAIAGRRDLVRVVMRNATCADQLERELGERVPVLARRSIGSEAEMHLVTEELPDTEAFAADLESRDEVSQVRTGIGSVALVGAGVQGRRDAARLLTHSLSGARIPVLATARTSHAVTAIIEAAQYPDAVRALHRAAISNFSVNGTSEKESISWAG